MKKNAYALVLCSLLLSFFSCKNDNKLESTECEQTIQINEPDGTSIIDLIDKESVFLVNPEKSDESLLGLISRVEVYKGHIYAKDMLVSKGIYIFNMDGKFVRKPTSIGQGPEEYTTLSDFKIDKKNDRLIINDRYNKTVSFLDLEGNFLNRKKVKFSGEYFAPLSNGEFAFFSDVSSVDGENTVIVTDNELKENRSYYPVNQNHNFILGVPTRLTLTDEGTILFSAPYDSKIYEITHNGFRPKYCFNCTFGKELPNDVATTLSPQNRSKTLNSEGYIVYRGDLINCKNSLCFSFTYGNGSSFNDQYLFFFDKESKKGKTVYKYSKEVLAGLLFNEPKGSYEDFFISVVGPEKLNAIDIESLDFPESFKTALRSVKEEDNPLLIFFKLKKIE